MRWTSRALFLSYTLAGLSLAGCGGSADPVPSTPAATSSPAAPSTPAAPTASGTKPAESSAASTDAKAAVDPMYANAPVPDPSQMPSSGGSSAVDPMYQSMTPDPSQFGGSGSTDSMYSNMYASGTSGSASGAAADGYSPLASISTGLQSQLQSVLSPLSASAGGQERPKPLTLRELANQAFVGGDEELALRYLYGHMVGEYELAGDAFGDVTYSAVLRKPVWMMRWGVSMHVRADDLSSPNPIVEGMSSPLVPRSRPGQPGAASGGADPAAATMAPPTYMASETAGAAADKDAGADTAVSPQVDAVFAKNLGLVAESAGGLFDSRFRNGAFGRGFQGVMVTPVDAPAKGGRVDPRTGERIDEPMAMTADPMVMTADPMVMTADPMVMTADPMIMTTGPGMPQIGRSALPEAPAAPSFSPALPRWRPGLLFLGELPLSESLPKAKENGLQFVLHFDVSVQGLKNRTLARVIQVADGKTVVVSKKIDNVEAYKLVQAEKTTEREYVDEIMSTMFTVIDEKLTVAPMPTITSAVAQRRVADLLETATAFDLAGMAEVRMFQYQDLLNEEQTAGAMHLFGGDNALVFVYGTPAERREIILREISE